MSAVPTIIVILPIEGKATARIWAASLEDERRAIVDVWDRSTILELAAAIERLRRALEEREEAA